MAIYHVFPFGAIDKNEEIVIWGAGFVGRQYVGQLLKTDYVRDFHVVDQSYQEILDFPVRVCSPDFLLHNSFDRIIIAQSRVDIADEIRKTLIDMGITDHKICYDDQLLEYSFRDGEELIISLEKDILSKTKNLNTCLQQMLSQYRQMHRQLSDSVRNNQRSLWMHHELGINELHFRFEEVKQIATHYRKWIPDISNRILDHMDQFEGRFLDERELIKEILLSCCDLNEKKICLDGANLYFDNIDDLTVIMREILETEDYFFEASVDTPFIIDGGANIGMACYYFLHLYPNAKIIAFEPNPRIFEILKRNIAENHWTNVTAYPYALSDRENELSFYMQESGLAGSLERRNLEDYDGEVSEYKVKTIPLSRFIEDHIDYLKLDVEGSETRVLREIQKIIEKIDYIFIEFHEGQSKGDNSISEILSVLELNGFDVNIDKNGFQRDIRPMNRVGGRVSEVLWAKKKHLVVIPRIECHYYKDISFLRVNAYVESKVELYIRLHQNVLGVLRQKIYVNDEETGMGSNIWNAGFYLNIAEHLNESDILYVVDKEGKVWKEVHINIEYRCPQCYDSHIGTKNTLTINDGSEEDFLKKFMSKPAINSLKKICIETSSCCNLRCKYCLVGQNYDSISRGVLSDDVRRRAIQILNELPAVNIVQLNGLGEPMLYSDFPGLCREIYVQTNVRKVMFFTNGMLFNKKIIDELLTIPLTFFIFFSIDGNSVAENNHNRSASDYEVIKKNINYLLGRSVGKTNLRIAIKNLHLNEEDAIPGFLLNDFGNLSIDSHRAFYFPELSTEHLEEDGIHIYSRKEKRLCVRPFTEATIRYNGDVIVCHWDSACRMKMGNVLNEAFTDIWNGEKYQNVRESFFAGGECNETCQSCHAMNNGFLYYSSNKHI